MPALSIVVPSISQNHISLQILSPILRLSPVLAENRFPGFPNRFLHQSSHFSPILEFGVDIELLFQMFENIEAALVCLHLPMILSGFVIDTTIFVLKNEQANSTYYSHSQVVGVGSRFQFPEMEATEPELNGSGHRVIKQSYNSDEACLHDVDNFHLLHPEVSQEEGLIKHNDSSSSSEASHENMIEVVTGIESGSVLLEHGTPSELIDDRSAEEDKDESPDSGIEMPSPDYTDATHSTSPFDIPTIQVMERNEHYDPDRIPESVFASNETMASREWSATSNESLFSIHPETISYGGDQPLLLPSEMHKEKEMQESDESPFMSIGKERRLEASQGKIHRLGQDEAKPPNATLIPSNPSPRSDGSEGSDYSFAFPILVANTLRSSSNRGDALSSGWRPARGHHLGAQRSSARQGPASPHKRGRCSSCFSCPCAHLSCFSCCTRPSCQSRCNPQSCLSCWPCR